MFLWHDNKENAHKIEQGGFICLLQFIELGTFFHSKVKFVYFPNDLEISLKNLRNLNKQMHKKQGAPNLC